MKPTIDIYLGAPVDIESEQRFLKQLTNDLRASGQDALVLANFHANRRFQIDFLVITAARTCHVELKNLTAPVAGGDNGPWKLRQPNGDIEPLDAKNPYRQALDCKYAISDDMAIVAKREHLPQVPRGKKHYQYFESAVCVFPELLPGSDVFQDFRVRVCGYAELLGFLLAPGKTQLWAKEHWLNFAMHLNLVRQADEQDVRSIEITAAQAALESYAQRFAELCRADLHELVPTTVRRGNESTQSDSINEIFEQGTHAQLIGPSGCGKTHHAKHAALNVISSGRLPVFVSAKDYADKLSALLNHAVAPYFPNTAMVLFDAAQRTGTPLSLIIDGFNECSPDQRTRMIADIQALYLRWNLPVLFTAQSEISLPENLAGHVLYFADLAESESRAVFDSYHPGEASNDARDICQSFQSAYEISIAAKCLSDLPTCTTRPQLLDAYILQQCGQTAAPLTARTILRALAREMNERLSETLPLSDVWRIIEPIMHRERVPLGLAEDILHSKLLDIAQGRCAFRHELLTRFLQAEALITGHPEQDMLSDALRRPRSQAQGEFVIGLLSSPDAVRSCLVAIADAKLLARCLRGEVGPVAKSVVETDCLRVLSQAEYCLDSLRVKFNQQTTSWETPDVAGTPVWSDYELGLMDAIGIAIFEGFFLDRVVGLIEGTEDRCLQCVAADAKDGQDSRPTRSQFFAGLYVWPPMGSHDVLPAMRIIHSCHNEFREATDPEVIHKIVSSPAGLADRHLGVLYLLCLLARGAPSEYAAQIPPLLQACWRTRVYHLCLESVSTAERFARVPEGAIRDGITECLKSMISSNVLLNTAIVQAMDCYGVIEPSVTSDVAESEFSQALVNPDDAQAQQLAYNAYTNIFEDLVSEPYWEAFHQLDPDDQATILTMAALGAPEYGWFTDHILSELLRHDAATSGPAFVRWTANIDVDAMCRQDATLCFLYGHTGAARFLESPPQLRDLSTPNHEVWQLLGEIVFWIHVPKLDKSVVIQRCAPLWDRVREEFAFEAVDALIQFEQVTWKTGHRDIDPARQLFSLFTEQIRQLLEFGLENGEHLTSIFRSAGPVRGVEIDHAIIKLLGKLGTEDSVAVLEKYVDDPRIGTEIVDAIRAIRRRAISHGTTDKRSD